MEKLIADFNEGAEQRCSSMGTKINEFQTKVDESKGEVPENLKQKMDDAKATFAEWQAKVVSACSAKLKKTDFNI